MSQQQSQDLGFLESKASAREGEDDIWFWFLFLGKSFPTILSFPPHPPLNLGRNKKTRKLSAHKLNKMQLK